MAIQKIFADREYVDAQINAIPDPIIVEEVTESVYVLESSDIDTTLAQSGKVADAKIVGNKINLIFDEIGKINKDSIVEEVIAALGTPVFGTVDENKHITLSGHLADGTYTISFEDADGFVVGAVGEINKASMPTYTNLFEPATATLNTRMSGTSSAPKAQDGYVMTAAITIPATVVKPTTDDSTPYIAVRAQHWMGSANIFYYDDGAVGNYADCGTTTGTIDGDWVKIPVKAQWTNTVTATSMVMSLYVGASAISASDIRDIEIYFNECPEA